MSPLDSISRITANHQFVGQVVYHPLRVTKDDPELEMMKIDQWGQIKASVLDRPTNFVVSFVLSQKRSYEFKQLFEVVHDNLRRRNAAYGGEEILRLRAYDKLQKLVFGGAVKKSGKIYTGNSAALATMAANAPHADPIKSNA